MALALIGEAAVGAVAGELLKAVLELKRTETSFEVILNRLESTLYKISPIIQEIERQICLLGRPNREKQILAMISEELEKGEELVCKCLKVGRWNYYKRIRYGKRLEKLDESLRRFLAVDTQALMARDVKEILLHLRRMVGPNCLTDVTLGVMQSSNGQTQGFLVRIRSQGRKELTKALQLKPEMTGVEYAALEGKRSVCSVAGTFDCFELISFLCEHGRFLEIVSMTVLEGNQDLNSGLLSISAMAPSSTPSSSELVALKSYVPTENETIAGREVASHGDLVNSDNKKKENDEFEEMSRKCGPVMERLDVLQDTVRGLKLLIVTSVMVSLLSLIMNFVILMYK